MSKGNSGSPEPPIGPELGDNGEPEARPSGAAGQDHYPRPERAHCCSLISHSRRPVCRSCAAALGVLGCLSRKYAPLTSATSGELASHTSVSAPFGALRDIGLRIVMPRSISSPLLRLNPVATSPGWKQLAVTAVPARRCANSAVNRMLASLVSP